MKRIITGAIVSAAFSILAYLFLVYLEGYYLYDIFEAQPSGKLRLDIWINEFYENALATIVIAFFGVLAWYLTGYFIYRINNWKKAGGFRIWLLIFVLTIIAVFAYGFNYTQETDDTGKYRACLFYVINAALIYWLSTAIFSPSSVKYAPLGSMRLRLASLGNLLVRRLG